MVTEVRDTEILKAMELKEKMGLHFVRAFVISEPPKVVIAPFENGQYSRDELLRKEIPFEYILAIHQLFPDLPLFVRGLVTEQERELGLA